VTTQISGISQLRDAIAPARRRLEMHPLYSEIKELRQLRIFLESHVFAVWDFMSLLKSLQASITCVAIPWVPSAFPQSRRLVNEIVLGEESDAFGSGYLSHFELYLRAMDQTGADATSIRRLVGEITAGRSLTQALVLAEPPPEALAFVRATFAFVQPEKPHVTAAAFTFGREDLIPDMFHHMVKDLRQHFDGVRLFEYYLERHIEVDGDSHGPMALQMMEELCGNDPYKWEESIAAAVAALEARLALWDGILLRIS